MDPLANEDNRIPIAPGLSLPAGAVRFTFARAGGPGGQNVNKLATQAILTVDLADLAAVLPAAALARLERRGASYITADGRLRITAATHRSQLANRKAALARLRELVVAALHRPRPRKPTRPSAGAIQRRLETKKQRGKRKAARRFDRNPPRE